MISGITSHKLDLISTYSSTQPFKIGTNGVTNISYNTDGSISQIFYTIGEINYITNFIVTENKKNAFPTIFFSGIDDSETQNINIIKEEAKMGMVFPPKINNDLFIERMSLAVFERHSRLATIKSLGSLEEYSNGYYNVIKNT